MCNTLGKMTFRWYSFTMEAFILPHTSMLVAIECESILHVISQSSAFQEISGWELPKESSSCCINRLSDALLLIAKKLMKDCVAFRLFKELLFCLVSPLENVIQSYYNYLLLVPKIVTHAPNPPDIYWMKFTRKQIYLALLQFQVSKGFWPVQEILKHFFPKVVAVTTCNTQILNFLAFTISSFLMWWCGKLFKHHFISSLLHFSYSLKVPLC